MKYREDYEKAKASTDYNVLPATENPLLRHLKAAGNLVNDVSILHGGFWPDPMNSSYYCCS